MPNTSNYKNTFPFYNQPGSDASMINRARIRQLATSSPRFTLAEIAEKQKKHLLFLESGGAGGYWQSIHLKGVTFGLYFGAEATSGEQASFEHQQLQSPCHLQHSVFPFANFCGCCMEGIDFSDSNLTCTLFTDAFLQKSNFSNSNLVNADFTRADLRGVDFSNCILVGADFENCDLRGANFTGADLSQTVFPGAKLDGVIV